MQDTFVLLAPCFFVFLEVSPFSALFPYSIDPLTSQKTYFWPWLFIVLIILSLWCFVFVQAFGNILKQNLVADVGSFWKSICKCILRYGFRLDLGLLKLCEVCVFSVLFRRCSLLLSLLLTFIDVMLIFQICNKRCMYLRQQQSSPSCKHKQNEHMYDKNWYCGIKFSFGDHLGKADQIDSCNLSSNC